jgi:hypothetical protein
LNHIFHSFIFLFHFIASLYSPTQLHLFQRNLRFSIQFFQSSTPSSSYFLLNSYSFFSSISSFSNAQHVPEIWPKIIFVDEQSMVRTAIRTVHFFYSMLDYLSSISCCRFLVYFFNPPFTAPSPGITPK